MIYCNNYQPISKDKGRCLIRKAMFCGERWVKFRERMQIKGTCNTWPNLFDPENDVQECPHAEYATIRGYKKCCYKEDVE